ncbi:MAG TPA: PAS domain-containing protein, partial [Chitinophagaceae bacterium]|nr:PAS domain-containing protein [Chitinophagaceae bacterium]
LLTIEDVTQQRKGEQIIREREAWFHTMADNSPVMIWVTGTDKLCNFVNKTLLEFRGITLQEAIGNEWTEGAIKEDKERCDKIYKESFEKKQPFELTYRIRNKDGKATLVLTKAKPNYTTEGDFTGYIGSCVPIDGPIKNELEEKL